MTLERSLSSLTIVVFMYGLDIEINMAKYSIVDIVGIMPVLVVVPLS